MNWLDSIRAIEDLEDAEFDPGLVSPEVVGNSNELEQVLVILVRNAADAVEEGGSIVVTVDAEAVDSTSAHYEARAVSRHQDDPGAGTRRGRVVVTVTDDGCGMDAETKARMMEPFFTTKPPGAGTGLGLWIAYNIVTEHGGRLDVRSAPGEGTRVSITLVLAPEHPV